MTGAGFLLTPGGEPREDRTRVLSVSLLHRAFTLNGFSPGLTLARETRRSNAQLHDYRRTRIELQLRAPVLEWDPFPFRLKRKSGLPLRRAQDRPSIRGSAATRDEGARVEGLPPVSYRSGAPLPPALPFPQENGSQHQTCGCWKAGADARLPIRPDIYEIDIEVSEPDTHILHNFE